MLCFSEKLIIDKHDIAFKFLINNYFGDLSIYNAFTPSYELFFSEKVNVQNPFLIFLELRGITLTSTIYYNKNEWVSISMKFLSEL